VRKQNEGKGGLASLGQKIHPKGLRLGIVKDWDARWFRGKKQFVDTLHEDFKLRNHIKAKYYLAGVPRIEIERAANRIRVVVHTAKPGMVIGRGGTGVDELRRELEALAEGKQVSVNIVEVKSPETDAQLVAESVASALEKRISFRRAIKQAVSRAIKAGAEGAKVRVSGRLGGAEMSRSEWASEGSIPLHTLRADVDYGFAEAHAPYGRIGVKAWVYKGDILPERAAEDTPGARHDEGGSQQRPAAEGGE
jgi:small subunit ribosomal protein S3